MNVQRVEEGPVERWMLFLHGLMGSGGNWRTFARRMVAARPGWGAALVDLRMHGLSQGLAPPHTVAAAAADLQEVAAALPGPVAGILGHSFGGKVALRALADSPIPALTEVWVIDSTPGARPDARGSEGTLRVLRALRDLGLSHPSRAAFVAGMTGRGISTPVAQWLAMNLDPSGTSREGGLRFRLDLSAIDALLWDYLRSDLWPMITPPPPGVQVHLVAAGRSPSFNDEDRARALQLGADNGRVSLHVLPQAGHDIHVDDPDGLLGLLCAAAP